MDGWMDGLGRRRRCFVVTNTATHTTHTYNSSFFLFYVVLVVAGAKDWRRDCRLSYAHRSCTRKVSWRQSERRSTQRRGYSIEFKLAIFCSACRSMLDM